MIRQRVSAETLIRMGTCTIVAYEVDMKHGKRKAQIGTTADAVERLKREARQKSVTVSFWGDLTLDPEHVFVTRPQAERSVKHLRDLVQKRRAG